MRISTNSLYETGTAQLGTLQSNMERIQQQVATGKRNLTAADDPTTPEQPAANKAWRPGLEKGM